VETVGPPATRTTLAARYVRVLVFCNSCCRQADADLQAIVDASRGDAPLTELRFRCRAGRACARTRDQTDEAAAAARAINTQP
jgi:hypothetical protein